MATKLKTYLNEDAIRFVLDHLDALRNIGASPSHALVLIVIARHVYWWTGSTTLSLKRIASECRFTLVQTTDLIDFLVDRGWLVMGMNDEGQVAYAIAGYPG